MNKRKIILLAAVLVMVAVLGIGGTLAYFTDEDAKTNTFTVGNVHIEIDEVMQNEEGKWVEYTDEQDLAPITNDKAPFNKMVETVNTGKSNAYIRTFVTCPKDMYDYLGLGFNKTDKVLKGADYNMLGKDVYGLTKWTDVGTFTINDEETAVFLCEYEGVVEPGNSVLSLTKVWLYKNVTNEIVEDFDLAEGLFKIEVASQAIQAANLTYDAAMAELGEINQDLMDKLFND